MKSNWVKNYEHLLDLTCKYGIATKVKFEDLTAYSSAHSAWPNLGVNVFRFSELTKRNIEDIGKPITLLLPRFVSDKTLVEDLKRTYKRHGVWYQMEAESTDFSLPQNADFSRLKTVENEHDFKRWMDLVENTLLAERNLNHNAFGKMLQDQEIILVLGHHQNQAVSAAMFHPYENTLGLYFVVTLPEYRNLGLGSLITQYAFYLSKKMDLDTLVLQATPQGKKVYDHFGFTVLDEVDVFYTLND
ncbi:GNAT family N-acetyltransferase [Lishizhenia sp.]|uniref:GNAT family N-acetyltransferase n=1 Tax=Lishizhenia sp. TaxID=2497594 RepID=UPI00299D7A1B|nr:GNAT family N-acetyltransferase [Lishizhenia sp.]MDX1446919.1 GNAT family N-acetyltransferase [Lishizhenia sp.]